MISVLLWTFYLYVCNVQRVETVKIFRNLIKDEVKSYTRFQPSVASKTCLLIPDLGPCRSRITMWHFDPEGKTCKEFEWGGCQGNGNRFDSREECLDFCLSKPGTHRPRYCALAFDYGFCFGASLRYYYDSQWKVCKSRIYSGCGGNKNNFHSKEECDQMCRFGNAEKFKKTSTTGSGQKIIIINPESATTKKPRQATNIKATNNNGTVKLKG